MTSQAANTGRKFELSYSLILLHHSIFCSGDRQMPVCNMSCRRLEPLERCFAHRWVHTANQNEKRD